MATDSKSFSPQDYLFYTLFLLISTWLIYTFRVLFGPLIISALIAYLLYPAVTWLSKSAHINRRRVVLIVYLVFLSFTIWGLVVLAPQIVTQAAQLNTLLERLPAQIRSIAGDLESILGISLPLEAVSKDLETDLTQLLQPERAFRLIFSASTNVVWLVVIFITSFHLLRDWEKLREWFFGLVPSHLETEYRRLHQEIKAVWRSYLRGQVSIMFFIGLLSGVGAAIIGIPSALLLGILAGGLALIPNLGPAIATLIAAVVGWTQGSTYLNFSDITIAFLVVIVFQVVQMIEGFYLTPRIMGRRLALHPGVVLIAIVGTLFTLGALIALIIVPTISSLAIIVQYIKRKRSGLDPWPEKETDTDTVHLDQPSATESIEE
jgi:predicted PurR-regulated permease PerM